MVDNTQKPAEPKWVSEGNKPKEVSDKELVVAISTLYRGRLSKSREKWDVLKIMLVGEEGWRKRRGETGL